MNFPPTDFGTSGQAGNPPGNPAGGALPGSGRAQFGQASTSALGMKWSALHDAAAVVATLAGIAPEPMTAVLRNFPAVMRDAGGWRRAMAEQGIEDMSAFMEPGLSALLAVHARGVSPAPPAQALWQEFLAARDALVLLTPPPGEAGPMRRA
jgi:hypothetical protein